MGYHPWVVKSQTRLKRLSKHALEYNPVRVRVKGVPASPCAEAEPG